MTDDFSEDGQQAGSEQSYEDSFTGSPLYGETSRSESFGQSESSTDRPTVDDDEIRIGIPGLENVLGGIKPGSTIAVLGDSGTNPTTFALQFLNHGLVDGASVGLFSPVGDSTDLVQRGTSYGWDFDGARADGDLVVPTIDATGPDERRDAVTHVLSDLAQRDLQRVAVPDFDIYERLFEDERTRTHTVTSALSEFTDQSTVLVTSATETGDTYASQYRTVERIADVVLSLSVYNNNRNIYTGVTVLEGPGLIEKGPTPYEITKDGIEIYSTASIF
jgi:circadian clock protein KaiC